ncbi:MAG: PAS domain S-box protein [Desulfomonilia bacterium]|jgi:PAS domain S-box-containing protein|nr:PAS domain S-box protein [Deltaproteobacteria bacterium]MDX9762587.1 PAS domain S-box protein [Desulfomonilia bacterium]HPW69198.1 PAS domain S-box protein [Deltaproteobacteria bacterium]
MASEKYHKILQGMQEGYYETDLSGSLTYANDSLCRIIERSSEEILGLNFRSYTSKATARRVFKAFHETYLSGIPMRMEYEVILASGKKKMIDNSASLLRDQTGNPVGFCGIITDITRRKRLESQMRENRRRYEALFENANELIITTDSHGYIKRLNKKVEEVSGYTRKEMIGKSILMIAHPGDREVFIEFWKEILAGNTPRFELRAVAKGGETPYLLASGSVIRNGGKIVEIQYNAQVISDLKEAQHTILDLSNFLNSIIESSPNILICLNMAGKIQMANPVTSRIFRKPPSAVIGKGISFLSSDMQEFEDVIREVQKTRVPQFFHERALAGSSNQIFDISIYPLIDPVHGGAVFTAVDITEKKHMEIQLIHAQKMETIGELAGGVAHDFNNILTGISGNLAMLRYTTERTKQLAYLDTLEKISDRARDLVRQMLVFTKRHEGRPENISICQVIEEVIDMASKSIPKNIRFNLGNMGKNTLVYMDHTQLTQVLLNLVVNAKDAIGDRQRGRISIDVQVMSVDKNLKRHYLLNDTGKYVKVELADNGCGMSKEILPKIFDPFFSTKQKGTAKGTGLGLSITYNIIKNAGGGIQVQSEEGRGSQFSILLPASRSKKKPAAMEEKPFNERNSLKARILLVDDEDMLRDIGREMLEHLGHEVETAHDGNSCLDKLKTDSLGFDLVILDMIMPGLDGYHTLQEMFNNGLKTKVVISSGFSFEHERQEMLNNPLIVAKLNKPFNLSELSTVLGDILD